MQQHANCLEKNCRQYKFTIFLDSYRRIGRHDQKNRVLCALSDTLIRKNFREQECQLTTYASKHEYDKIKYDHKTSYTHVRSCTKSTRHGTHKREQREREIIVSGIQAPT